MTIMRDEIFGPVIPVMEFSNFEEGLRLANDSRFGLGAYLFTNDMNRIMRAVGDLERGELYINRGPGESIHGFHSGWKGEWHRRRRRQIRSGALPPEKDGLLEIRGLDLEPDA
jgi:acyl-CoA reductase-like NAD-dependent aldehyde dehydrogenase